MATYIFTTRHLDEVTNMQIGIGTRRVVIKNNCLRMVCCVLEKITSINKHFYITMGCLLYCIKSYPISKLCPKIYTDIENQLTYIESNSDLQIFKWFEITRLL